MQEVRDDALHPNLVGYFAYVKGTDANVSPFILQKDSVAIIRASLIVSMLHLKSCATIALTNAFRGTLSTNHVLKEILYVLSPNRNISTALQVFTGDPQERLILFSLAPIYLPSSSLIPFTELILNAQVEELRKMYKVQKSEEENIGLEGAILTRIAAKSILGSRN